ncbi:LysE family translocator [Paracraurococcus lichenis]|uniref:LysE family translocator n=1 Tax=Paracraurococcus lichenis TaxID=3064888 RepID=A0ABT9E9U9_9PROT|nr:LysE family translocator [Paracraurococcus sp. LOR1-02]MDO9712987.1 LysE family translocator [Paracraurococcus sp. LOR1-02]
MEGAAWLASAAGFALAMSATPGPNNAIAAATAANFGIRRSVPMMAGVAIGFPVMLLLVAFGASGLLHAVPAVMTALRWLGAAWMLWLAWGIATAAPPGPGTAPGRPMTLLQAALFQWVNPKAWIIAVGAIATYNADAAGALVLAMMFAVAAFGSLLAWAALGAGTARLLRRPAALRWFNRGMAALLVLSLLPVLAG